MQWALLLLVVAAFIPRAAAAQGEPVGPEFRVNTYTIDDQRKPAVAPDSSGNFVVVWHSYAQDGAMTYRHSGGQPPYAPPPAYGQPPYGQPPAGDPNTR